MSNSFQENAFRDSAFEAPSAPPRSGSGRKWLIPLLLQDGSPVSFPVSSEMDRDEQFFEAIQQRVD